MKTLQEITQEVEESRQAQKEVELYLSERRIENLTKNLINTGRPVEGPISEVSPLDIKLAIQMGLNVNFKDIEERESGGWFRQKKILIRYVVFSLT